MERVSADLVVLLAAEQGFPADRLGQAGPALELAPAQEDQPPVARQLPSLMVLVPRVAEPAALEVAPQVQATPPWRVHPVHRAMGEQHQAMRRELVPPVATPAELRGGLPAE